jgi:hypothetical protein
MSSKSFDNFLQSFIPSIPLLFLCFCPVAFHKVWFAGFYPFNGIGRANPCYGALVAVVADVVFDLEVERTIPERGATPDALGAPDAQFLVDDILEIGFFDVPPFNSRCRAKLVFAAGGAGVGIGFQVAAAQIAISAQVIGMDTLYSRRGFDALRSTPSTLCTSKRVDLPDPFLLCRTGKSSDSKTSYGQTESQPKSALDKFPPVFRLIFHPSIVFLPAGVCTLSKVCSCCTMMTPRNFATPPDCW